MNKLGHFKAVLPALSVLAFLLSTSAQAGSGCATIFATTYPESQTDDNAGCQTCHEDPTIGGPFNLYGADLRANGAMGAGFNCDQADFAAALSAVETLDSDNDNGGFSNIQEITAGTQPGWCAFDPNGGTCLESAATPPNTDLDPAPANAAPTAVAGGPYEGVAGTTLIQFDGSGSSDPDDDPLDYAWDFGDGNTASGMMPTHTYAAAGNFQVTLVVNDGTVDSEPSISSAAITEPVVNLAPTADAGGPYPGQPGQAVQFDGSGSSDPNGDALTYAWEFGDGAVGDGVTPTHVYAADGIYTVTLVVNDGQLSSDTATTTAEIATPPANRAPEADAGGPYDGETGADITFDGSASTDPDGDALTYSWNFGDGSMGMGEMPVHRYAMAGAYTVTLVVNDGEFDSAEATAVVEISDPVVRSDGQVLYDANCLFCHGDPWSGPAADDSLPGLRRVAGARSCNIHGSIFGTSVFPNGVPEMQFLQGLTEAEIDAMAEYLNSMDTTGEQRYVTTCAGCHGNDGSGGRTGEDVHGESASETWEAIEEESEMRYMACMPRSDIDQIANYLKGFDHDFDGDGINDNEDDDDDNDGLDDDVDSDDDNDGLDDDDEHHYGTDPRDDDTDDDGMSDGDEVHVFGTNPLVADRVNLDKKSNGGGSTGAPSLLILGLLAALARRARKTAGR